MEEEEFTVKSPFFRKREQITHSSRFLSSDVGVPSPVVPKVERSLSKEDANVRLFQVPFQSIGISICGGKIGSSGLQAFIAAVVPGSSSCSIRAHSLKAKSLVKMEIFIPTSIVADRRAVYLSPSLLDSGFPSKVFSPLLNVERSVRVWRSLLPNLPSLSPRDIYKLVVSIDQAAVVFKTPFKNKAVSFPSAVRVDNTENLVLPDYSLRCPVSDIDTLVTAMCGRIDGLYVNSNNLRGGIEGLQATLDADLGKLIASLVSELTLLLTSTSPRIIAITTTTTTTITAITTII